MNEIQFAFRGFTLKQCDILSSINLGLGIDSDPIDKKAHINLIHSRFTGPPLDKHWNGIQREFVQLFSDLKEELSEEQWMRAPELILDFIENFSEFTSIRKDFDRAVKEKETADRIDRERQLKQAHFEILEAEAKANLETIRQIGNQLAKEDARQRVAWSKDDYCPGCGQLLPLYDECGC